MSARGISTVDICKIACFSRNEYSRIDAPTYQVCTLHRFVAGAEIWRAPHASASHFSSMPTMPCRRSAGQNARIVQRRSSSREDARQLRAPVTKRGRVDGLREPRCFACPRRSNAFPRLTPGDGRLVDARLPNAVWRLEDADY